MSTVSDTLKFHRMVEKMDHGTQAGVVRKMRLTDWETVQGLWTGVSVKSMNKTEC